MVNAICRMIQNGGVEDTRSDDEDDVAEDADAQEGTGNSKKQN